MRPSAKAAAALAAILSLGLSIGFGADAGRAQSPASGPATPAVVAAPIASGPGVGLSPGTPIPPAELEAFVDGVVRSQMASRHIAGVAVSIVQNGQVVLKKGYGVSSLSPAAPVDPDRTLFRLASISKTFTWIALMKEAEAGHIRLTEPINLYLPEKLQIKDQGFKKPIVVRDLMTHSAGFEDRALGQLFEKDPRQVRPLADYLREERPRRVREAGSVPVYSNYGAALAGEAVSYVNGHPYQDIVDAEIIHPLGMSHTTFHEPYPARPDLPAPMPADLAAEVSTGYRWSGASYVPQSFEYVTQVAPAAALSSTAADMARYMQMILNGGQLDGATVYNPDTAKGFRTILQASAPGLNGWDDGFSDQALPGGFRGQGHGGDTLWFHSNMITVPDLNLGVFITTNTDTGAGLADLLPRMIVARFYTTGDPLPRAGVPALTDQARVYSGTYLNERRAYGGLEKFVTMLNGETTVGITPDGRLIIGKNGGAWVPDGPDGHFHRVDGPDVLAFDVVDGRAKKLYMPSGATVFDRVGLLHQIPTLAFLAALTALASIANIVGLFTRDWRELRQTPNQSRAGLVQTTIACLWLLCFAAIGLWSTGVSDIGRVMYHWPGPLLLIASACALVAALLTLLTLAMAPMVWRGGRRLDSWTSWRKLRFSISTLVYLSFSVTLLLWGALEPWSR
jgi:CubicO group peptidase (beta-lactamase class C family)